MELLRDANQASRPDVSRDYLLWRPLLTAAGVAVAYALLGIVYIHVSDSLAAALAPDKETLALIQEVKGTGYMLGSAGLLFGFTFFLFRRVHRETLDALRAHQALLDSERKASAAVVSLSVAHDINNQLQVLRSISFLLGEMTPPAALEGRRWLEGLNESIDKLDIMLADMRAGGRRSAVTDLVSVDLAEFAEESLHYLRHHNRLKRCQLDVVAEARPTLTICPGVLHDALLNLVLNAGDALQGQGVIRLEIHSDGPRAAIEVHDSGPGVPPEMQPVLFQPFHTTKPGGTGLGLLAVKACAELHRGEIRYQPSPLGGACFRMTLQSIERASGA